MPISFSADATYSHDELDVQLAMSWLAGHSPSLLLLESAAIRYVCGDIGKADFSETSSVSAIGEGGKSHGTKSLTLRPFVLTMACPLTCHYHEKKLS